MYLQHEITTTMRQGETSGEVSLTVIVREFPADEDGEKYYVAECLEIPGCVSEGDTPDEAKANIEDAMRDCLSVMFEDCIKQAIARQEVPNLIGISSQSRLHVRTTPQLQYEHA